MRICLFEDAGVHHLEPLALTRPAFELLCGLTTLGRKQCRYFAPCEVGVLVRPELAELYRVSQPSLRVNDLAWLRAEQTVLVNARWLPPPGAIDELAGPCVGLVGDEVAYAVVRADCLRYCSTNTMADCMEVWKQTLPLVNAGGRMVGYLWDLVAWNGEQITQDFEHDSARFGVGAPSRNVAVVGPSERLLIDPTARIDPMVVIDTTGGPVVIDREAVVTAFTRIEGPCYIGPGPQVFAQDPRRHHAGPHNARRRRGRSAASCTATPTSITTASSATAMSAEWVNLGAGTINSDLRNDYGKVSVWAPGDS